MQDELALYMTNIEKNFYNKWIEGEKSSNLKQELIYPDDIETIFEDIFDILENGGEKHTQKKLKSINDKKYGF